MEKSEHDRITELEEAFPEVLEQLSEISYALTEGRMAHGGLVAGIPIAALPGITGASAMFSLPLLASVVTVNDTFTGRCGNNVIYERLLSPGFHFITVTNEGECDALISVPGVSVPKAPGGGGVGGGFINIVGEASKKLSIKCASGSGPCSIKVRLSNGPFRRGDTFASTPAKAARCDQVVVKQTLQQGRYSISVKNHGDCPASIQAGPTLLPQAPPKGGGGGGEFEVRRLDQVTVKCLGGGTNCHVTYELKVL